MRNYEFDYTQGSYNINNNPDFNPLWVIAALGICLTVIALIYL